MNDLTTSDQTPLVILDPQPLDRNPAAVYLASLKSEKSRRTQLQALGVIAELLTGVPDALACNWAALRFQHTQVVQAKLAERYAAATANRMLSALRGVLRAAFLLDLVSAQDYQKAIMVKGVIGSTLPAGRGLQPGEITALMAACENDPTPAGVRDAAIIALMYACGLRREEVVKLELGWYTPETGALQIHGKRNKQRTGYLVNGAARAMADWLQLRGPDPGPLFWPINKAGRLAPRTMTPQAIYNLLAKRGATACIKSFSPHDLRRSCASDMLDAGADIATVAKILGHSNISTTQRYDRRPEQAKQKAAGLLHVPYRGKLV